MNQQDKRDIKAALLSSIPAILATSPLEVIKMNAQVTSSKVTIRGMFSEVYHTHSIKGFYKGIGVSLCGQPFFWSLYYPIKNGLTRQLSEVDGSIDFWRKSGAIFAASLMSSTLVNPLFVIKTRLQMSVLKKNPDGSLAHPHITSKKVLGDLWKNEGMRGVYKGNLVAQVKNTQLVPQMLMVDYFIDASWNPLQSSHFFLTDRAFVSGIAAKTIASCMLYYPVDVIRTNIRDNVENKSVLRIMREIVAKPGGVFNFYRGVGIYWISAVPTFGLITYGMNKLQKYF